MLKDTLSKFFKVDSLLSNLSGYVETRIELAKIEVKEQVGKGLARVVTYSLVAFLAAIFFVFVSIAGALLLGQILGPAMGFLIVGVFYLIVGVVVWLSRHKLIRKLEVLLTPPFSNEK